MVLATCALSDGYTFLKLEAAPVLLFGWGLSYSGHLTLVSCSWSPGATALRFLADFLTSIFMRNFSAPSRDTFTAFDTTSARLVGSGLRNSTPLDFSFVIRKPQRNGTLSVRGFLDLRLDSGFFIPMYQRMHASRVISCARQSASHIDHGDDSE